MAYIRAVKVVYFFAVCAFIASFALMIVRSDDGACQIKKSQNEEYASCFTDASASWGPTVQQGVDILKNSDGEPLPEVEPYDDEGLALEDCQALGNDGDCGAVVFSPETSREPSRCKLTNVWPWQIYKHLDNKAPPELSNATSIMYHAHCDEKEYSCDKNADCVDGKCVCTSSEKNLYW